MDRVGTVGAGTRTRLERRLGALDGAALIVSNVVGVGIFTVPGIVAGMVGGPGTFLAVWVAGGALALIGGLVYAELGGAYPEAGGEYVYIREAFGPLAAFLSGWTSLVAGFTGAIAAGAVGFAAYLEGIVPGLATEELGGAMQLGPLTLGLTPRRLVALALIAALSFVHAGGLGPGRRLQNALAGLSVATIVGLVSAGLALPSAGAAPGATTPPNGGGIFLALVLVMFTYSGWNAATYVAGEMRAPARSLHAAVLGGTLLVTLLYVGLNIVYLRALPFGEMQGSVAVAAAGGGGALGRSGEVAVAAVVSLALASGVSAMLLAGPRVYYAMARDGALPERFGTVHPETGVPSFGIVTQGAWAALLVLTGAFEDLLTYTGFAVVLFSAAAVSALFVLRRRPDHAARPGVRAWGHPWASALFLLASALMLVQAVRSAPGPSLTGMAIIAAGVPVHAWTRRRGSARPETPEPKTREPETSETGDHP